MSSTYFVGKICLVLLFFFKSRLHITLQTIALYGRAYKGPIWTGVPLFTYSRTELDHVNRCCFVDTSTLAKYVQPERRRKAGSRGKLVTRVEFETKKTTFSFSKGNFTPGRRALNVSKFRWKIRSNFVSNFSSKIYLAKNNPPTFTTF